MEISIINSMNMDQKIIIIEPPLITEFTLDNEIYYINIAYNGIHIHEYIDGRIKGKLGKSKKACLNIYTIFLKENELALKMTYAKHLFAGRVDIHMFNG
jgi:hypothetical protein